jgi:hypothetical protein
MAIRASIPPMSLHDASVTQMSKVLRNMEGWFDKAEAHAKAKGFEVDVLATARLAPDQYALVRQVQVACDNAKLTAAKLAGITPPSHPDTETTIAELRQRIRSTLAFLETVTPEQLADAAGREVTLTFLPGKAIKGADYLVDMALPNFYFHVTTAYAILRHNGVDVGKLDFFGHIRFYDLGSKDG